MCSWRRHMTWELLIAVPICTCVCTLVSSQMWKEKSFLQNGCARREKIAILLHSKIRISMYEICNQKSIWCIYCVASTFMKWFIYIKNEKNCSYYCKQTKFCKRSTIKSKLQFREIKTIELKWDNMVHIKQFLRKWMNHIVYT